MKTLVLAPAPKDSGYAALVVGTFDRETREIALLEAQLPVRADGKVLTVAGKVPTTKQRETLLAATIDEAKTRRAEVAV